MKNLKWTLAALLGTAALVALSPLAVADGAEHESTHFRISTSDAGTVEFDLDELAVGESRSFTTDQGKPVTLTRVEAGYELEVDGKKLDVILDGEAGEGLRIRTAGDGDEGREVVVLKKHLGGDSGEPTIIVTGDGDDGEGGKKVVRKRIVTSGGDGDHEVQVKVLDGDDLEGIDLEALAGREHGDGHVIVVKKKIHEGEAGEHGDEPKRVEIRIEKKVKKVVEQDDDRR